MSNERGDSRSLPPCLPPPATTCHLPPAPHHLPAPATCHHTPPHTTTHHHLPPHTTCHLPPPATTCHHLPLPATCHHLPPAAATCQQLPATATCHHLPSPAATCHHLPPAAATCHHLPPPATCHHRPPYATTCRPRRLCSILAKPFAGHTTATAAWTSAWRRRRVRDDEVIDPLCKDGNCAFTLILAMSQSKHSVQSLRHLVADRLAEKGASECDVLDAREMGRPVSPAVVSEAVKAVGGKVVLSLSDGGGVYRAGTGSFLGTIFLRDGCGEKGHYFGRRGHVARKERLPPLPARHVKSVLRSAKDEEKRLEKLATSGNIPDELRIISKFTADKRWMRGGAGQQVRMFSSSSGVACGCATTCHQLRPPASNCHLPSPATTCLHLPPPATTCHLPPAACHLLPPPATCHHLPPAATCFHLPPASTCHLSPRRHLSPPATRHHLPLAASCHLHLPPPATTCCLAEGHNPLQFCGHNMTCVVCMSRARHASVIAILPILTVLGIPPASWQRSSWRWWQQSWLRSWRRSSQRSWRRSSQRSWRWSWRRSCLQRSWRRDPARWG